MSRQHCSLKTVVALLQENAESLQKISQSSFVTPLKHKHKQEHHIELSKYLTAKSGTTSKWFDAVILTEKGVAKLIMANGRFI